VIEIFALAFAGALGSLGRYALSGLTYRLLGNGFAWGTFAVNVLGCFMLGFTMQLGLSSEAIPRTLRVAVTVGFLGAFTTFSTFGYETTRYLEDGAWMLALTNVGASVIVGLLSTWLGLTAARAALGGA